MNFGSFGAAKTTSSGTPSFGGFSSLGATTSAAPTALFGGFGATQTAQTQQPTAQANPFSFGGSNPTTTTSTFGGFGGPSTNTSTFTMGQQPTSTAPGASAFPSFTSGLGAFAPQSSAVQSIDPSLQNLSIDTPYKSLPSHIQAAFIEVYKTYKKPAREHLATISKVHERKFDDLFDQLKTSRITINRLLFTLEGLVQNVNDLQKQYQGTSRSIDDYGFAGLKQIKSRAIADDPRPIHPFSSVLLDLDAKLKLCTSMIENLWHQVSSTSQVSHSTVICHVTWHQIGS